MAKLQVHAASDEASLQHWAAPARSFDYDQNRLWAKLGMPRNKRLPLAARHNGIFAVLRLYTQNAVGRQVAQEDAALDLRLNDVVVHPVAQVWVRRRELRASSHSERPQTEHSIAQSRAGASPVSSWKMLR